MIWKINKDLKGSILPFASVMLSSWKPWLLIVKASIASVIQLSLTFPHRTDKARMNSIFEARCLNYANNYSHIINMDDIRQERFSEGPILSLNKRLK